MHHPRHAEQLPSAFREIRLELARERQFPNGNSAYGYVIVAPLDRDAKIDADLWKKHREACRVARFRPTRDDALGHLVHRPGGSWAFHYDVAGNEDDESGYHFQDERFQIGEYVSIHENDAMHTYVVASVQPL
jgi:hypothetical protein